MGRSSLVLIFLSIVGACVLGRELRGNDVCAKGQSYWCQNITTAAKCSAVKHCIQGVWEHETPIEVDRSEVCQTCLDMVKQARDQLLSNETQEEIKEVLDGSCKLIPIKIVREECIKLMDNFGSELIDTLASQMDPQVVCSVAGLCNNNRVHMLEAAYKQQHPATREGKLDCDNCNTVVSVIRQKFEAMDPAEFLSILAEMCSKMGSYSDSCFAIAVREHRDGLEWLRHKVQSRPVCSLAGVCRPHDRHSVSMLKNEGVAVRVMGPNGDLPCDLCIQLVQHLRDILISNTTEADFKTVLLSLCNQMSHYKDECLTIVNGYYDAIYQFLMTELNGEILCKEIKICPGRVASDQFVRPLLAVDTAVNNNFENVQLPLRRMFPFTFMPSSIVSNSPNTDQTLCSMCEFFLHFVQQQITLPSSEDEIKVVVEKGCAMLPSSVSDQCKAFIDTYMDEFIALLAQEIDPSLVCPMVGVCPRGLVAVAYRDKPDCPLCLLAFQEISVKMRNKNLTADSIGDVVDDLCIRDEFPNSLSMECVSFVRQHRSHIVDMVLTEFTPQESCAYIEVCIPSEVIQHLPTPEDTHTNEIMERMEPQDPNACVLCEFVMTKIANMLKDKKTEEEIKNAVFRVCDIMPKTVTSKCRQFITQYADLVIELLAQEMDPKEVCTALNLCAKATSLIKASLEKCLVCEVLMDALRTVLSDPDVDDNINKQLDIACRNVPDRLLNTCRMLVHELAPQIEIALRTLPVGPLICRRIMVCEAGDNRGSAVASPIPSKHKCISGSAFWCISSAHAAMCNAVEFCQKEVWKGPKPRRGHNKGRIIISN